MKFNPKVMALTGVTALALIIGGTAGATAGALIGSQQIKDDSVRSIDVRDRTIQPNDLSGATKRYIKSFAGQDGAPGADGEDGAPGAPGEAAGVSTDWVANPGSEVVNASTVRLFDAPTSVEVQNLNLPVQAGQVIEFTYRLAGGATYGGGSPRVFVEMQGDYINTFDGPGDPAAAPGVDNGDGTFTKTFTIPKNGRIGQAGVVKDSGVGSVTVTDLRIAGQAIAFQ